MRAAIAVAVALVLAGAVGVSQWFFAGTDEAEVPTYTVAEQAFVRRVTADGNLRAVQAVEIVIPPTPGMWVARKLAWFARDGSAVKAGDVVVRFDPMDAQRQLVEATADLDAADVMLHKERVRAAAVIADRDAAAALARDEVEHLRRFRARDPQLYSRNQLVEAELDERVAAARHGAAESARTLDRRVAQTNVELRGIARERAALALGHARTALANMELRAPGDGVLVLRRDYHGDLPKLGTQLYPGNAIADLPVTDAMEAELFVLEVDGSGIEVNQPADIVVQSRPDRVFHGKVRLVDRLAKPREPGVPVQYFSTIVALDRTDREVMKPGQRVHATLVLDTRRAIAVPRQAVFESAGHRVAYVRGEHGFAPRTVDLGPATAGRVVVTAGLVAGDVIALRDPTQGAP